MSLLFVDLDQPSTHWRKTAPCKGQPGFTRNGDDPMWEVSIPAYKARILCNTCPYRRECARAALTSGAGFDAEGSSVADDVIAAGIICAGDRRTRDALHVIASGRSYNPRATEAEVQARTADTDVPLFDLDAA